MSSDDYDDLIEYICDESVQYDASTSSQRKRKKSENTTKNQFQKLTDFMKSHNKETLGKEQFDLSWYTLVRELNQLGPPSHSSSEWKGILKDNKSKQLKKMKATNVESSNVPQASHPDTKNWRIEQQPSSSPAVVEKHNRPKRKTLKLVETVEFIPSNVENSREPDTLLSKNDNIDRLKNVDEKLDTIIQEVKNLKENMVTEHKKTNELLEKLLSK